MKDNRNFKYIDRNSNILQLKYNNNRLTVLINDASVELSEQQTKDTINGLNSSFWDAYGVSDTNSDHIQLIYGPVSDPSPFVVECNHDYFMKFSFAHNIKDEIHSNINTVYVSQYNFFQIREYVMNLQQGKEVNKASVSQNNLTICNKDTTLTVIKTDECLRFELTDQFHDLTFSCDKDESYLIFGLFSDCFIDTCIGYMKHDHCDEDGDYFEKLEFRPIVNINKDTDAIKLQVSIKYKHQGEKSSVVKIRLNRNQFLKLNDFIED